MSTFILTALPAGEVDPERPVVRREDERLADLGAVMVGDLAEATQG